jgi:peptidoglycan/LPS O-acetylase OafA/YrhL
MLFGGLGATFLARLVRAWSPQANIRSLFAQPSRSGRLAPFDGARALALLWVLALHTLFNTCARPDGEALIAQRWKNSWATQFTANGDAGEDGTAWRPAAAVWERTL